MTNPVRFDGEIRSNAARQVISNGEPLSFRTQTSTLAVLDRSAGVFHWTPDGRQLYDYTSGVLVANLGHNPVRWMERWWSYLGWPADLTLRSKETHFAAAPFTSYNAISELEALAVERLLASVRATALGCRLNRVVWAASGAEAVHKAIFACLSDDAQRDIIVATRFGYHGKKGLSYAVTGSEADPHRDPRVRFIGFPRDEVADMTLSGSEWVIDRYRAELETLWSEWGSRLRCLITEPYLGGGGSYHPPAAYLQMLQQFCQQHNIPFILDEVQANFGRTGQMYAFETYGVEPDFVVLGKGLGNGVPVAAVVGRGDILNQQGYGETSDTWSGNPLSCAAVLATLDTFEQEPILQNANRLSQQLTNGLLALKGMGPVRHVRGEGVVFGLECQECGVHSARDVALAVVRNAYLGDGRLGVHLLGPLAGKVLRVSPPLVMTETEAAESLQLLHHAVVATARQLVS